ncbi:protein-glutamate O-methyltransferase CheR [bacterium AH-315-L15]|nr:protein-glutamate O-methyltransferase CheR [bacterium AH-315-L15]
MLTKGTLEFFFQLLHRESGLVLDESKQYLIETRLEPLAVQEGFASIEALGKALKQNTNPLLRQKVVDAMTTNETSFFRDRRPFDAMKEEILPTLIKAKAENKKIRIWCAASSSGQEPYSIAMLLCEMGIELKGWHVRILATDIADTVLKKARSGTYSQHEIQRGLPTPYLLRYFDQKNSMWVIRDSVKKFIEFRQINLLSSFSSIGPVDVIFCRNILIYFDKKTKEDVLNRMADVLSPSGILFMGISETLIGMGTRLVCIGGKQGSYYKRNGVLAA